MFAYCRNCPASRIDTAGLADADCFDTDGAPLSSDELEDRKGGGGGNYTSAGAGFSSFRQLKAYLGSPGENNHWHHIVEQSQIGRSGFTSEQINNTSNIVAINQGIHGKVTGYYNTTTFAFTGGLSVRDWLAGQPYPVQFDFGMGVLKKFGAI